MNDGDRCVSLEKYMYFIPNRFYADRKELFVSFNVGVIPVDMTVTEATMSLPLNTHAGGRRFEIRTIDSGWAEKTIAKGTRPTLSKNGARILRTGDEEEIKISVLESMRKWRFESLTNHGIYVRLLGMRVPELFRPLLPFSNEKPPYLVVATL